MQHKRVIRFVIGFLFISLIYGISSTPASAATVLTEADCATCHADIYGEANRSSRIGLHHNAGIPDCNQCHFDETIGDFRADFSCTACHGQIPDPLFHETAHTISELPECATCHAPPLDGLWSGIEAIHNAPTNGAGPCATCHSSPRTDVQNFISTKAVLDCADCHNAHVFNDIHSITETGGCASCHDPLDGTLSGIEAVHDTPTNGAGTCATCHSSNRTDVQDFIANRTPVECIDCHAVHVFNDIHSITETAGCASCHAPPLDGTLTGIEAIHDTPTNGAGTCATCHDSTRDPVPALIAAKNPVECASCHNAHVFNDIHSISEDPGCIVCHTDLDGTLTGIEAVHDLPINGAGTCATCHDSSRTVVQDAIDARAPVTCGNCHTPHGTTPAGAAAVHNSFNESNDCTACHLSGTAEERLALHADCLTCHDSTNDPVMTAIADGRNGTPVQCETCHYETNTIKYHNLNAAGVVGEHNNLGGPATTCANCHETGTVEARIVLHPACEICHTSGLNDVLATINAGKGAAGTLQSCEDCHSGAGTGAPVHGETPATVADSHDQFGGAATSCADCHAAATAEERIALHPNCSTCHDSTNSMVMGAISTGRSGNPVDCFSCHITGGAPVHGTTPETAANVHDYFNDSATCTDCHDTSLAADRLALHVDCTTCHASTNNAVMTAIGDGRSNTPVSCENCHDDPGVLMHGMTAADAAGIHDNLAEPAPNTCADCHMTADDSAQARIMLHTDCTTCHTSAKTTVSTAIIAGIGGAAQSCADCHTGPPAGADANGAINHGSTSADVAPSHDFFIDSATCTVCHDTDTAVERLDEHPDCTTCHSSTNGAVMATIASGRANTAVSCENCHDDSGVLMHGMTAADAAGIHDNLAEPAPNTCADCHMTADDSAQARIMLHTDCTTCHTSAKTTVSTAIIAGIGGAAQSCADCHTGPPAGADANGAINHGSTSVDVAPSHDFFIDSATCTVCHDTDTAVERLDEHPDCTTCHSSTNGAVMATIASGRANTAVSCENCHEDPGVLMHGMTAADAAGIHDNLAEPAPNTCADCHMTADDSAQARIMLHTDCTTCHTSAKTTVSTAIIAGIGGAAQSCADCHTGPPAGADANGAINHGSTSADVAPSHDFFIDSATCTACHDTDLPIERLDEHADCTTCHSSTNGAVMATIASGRANTAVSCENCHDDPGVLMHGLTAADAAPIHNNFMGSTNCGQCHDIDTTAKRIDAHTDCTTCHTSMDTTVVNAINSAKGASTITVSCETCHGDYSHPNATHSRITNVGTICFDCHGQDLTPPPPGQAVSVIHKDQCLLCHTSTRPSVVASIAEGKQGSLQYCTDCHMPTDPLPVDPATHHINAHNMSKVQEQVCADCHSENVATEHYEKRNIACGTCHTGVLATVVEPGRGPNGTPVYCNNCHFSTDMTSHKNDHDKTVLPDPTADIDCSQCHVANVAVEHVDNRSLACTVCHASTNAGVQSAIAAGSGFNGTTVNCSDCHTGPLDHKASHNDIQFIDPPDASCADCHSSNVVTVHVDERGLSCATCHSGAIASIVERGVNGETIYCATCHFGSDHSKPDTHDQTITSATDSTCVECHDNDVSIEHVTNRGRECTICHTVAQYEPVIQSGIDGNQVTCAQCHTNAGDHKQQHDMVGVPSVDCEACHDNNVVVEHVDNRLYECSTCHSSTNADVQATIANGRNNIAQDCYNCHMDTGGHEAAHDSTDVPSQDCAACHNKNVATEHVTNRGLSCTACHSSTDQDVIDAIENGKNGATVVCTDCHQNVNHSNSHADTNVPEPLCENCHDPNVFVEHVSVRGRDCSICHNPTYQGVIDQGVANQITVTCTTCHQTPDHHSNDTARTGQCTFCHADPRPLENDPQQLACRQCHVNSQGYVQTSAPAPNHAWNTDPDPNLRKIDDFGACFACHAPVPYHPKPSSWPGWYEEIHDAPGRGSFNIFYNELQPSCAPDCEGTSIENRSGYGEGSQPERDGGRNWRNPNVNFFWFPIVYQGDAMDVPAFDPADDFPPYPHSRINAVGNCGDCHTVGTVVSVTHDNNCVGCHLSQVKTVQNVISWARSGNDVNCYDCHGEGGHAAQHDMTQLNQASCSECHVDNVVTEHVDNRGLACAVCHDNPAYATVINNGKNGFTVTCFDCHGTADHLSLHAQTNVDEPGCADCHNPNIVTEHLTNQGLDCVDCHDSTDPDVEDTIAGTNGSVTCRDCHGQDAGEHAAAHDNAGPTPGSNCTDCHAGNVVTEHVDNRGRTCGDCHDNPIYSGQIADGKAGTYQTCEDCHGPGAGDHAAAHDHAGVPSAGCTNCHSDNVVQEHVYDRSLSCNVCHDNPAYASVIDTGKSGIMVTCYDCHGTNTHHETAESQAGDCTFCHADPRLDVDPDAPVGQLACAECHGPMQHNNGGPIQDFGACFACHQPTPYHAKPISRPRDCYVGGPGQGSFNIFSSEFGGGGERDRRNDNCEDRENNYRNPAISFSWISIIDTLGSNQEWTVPTFEAGDGSTGGGTQNDSVNITYASYSSRRDRLTVYAENSLGGNAQLTVQYDGDNYQMSWDSGDNRWEIRISTSRCNDSSIEVSSSAGGSDSSSVSNCSSGGWGW